MIRYFASFLPLQVKVEKYLTPEQWQKMEEDRKKDEERKLKERGDNWRERGLEKMMGGVLEIKREDELKKVLTLMIAAAIIINGFQIELAKQHVKINMYMHLNGSDFYILLFLSTEL